MNTQNGFTLIEIIVVMVLAVMTVSLVVPRFYGAFDNFQADAEEQAFLELLEHSAYMAYFQCRETTLSFNENHIRTPDGEDVAAFRFLNFPEQTVVWNARGFTLAAGIDYLVQGRARRVDSPFIPAEISF